MYGSLSKLQLVREQGYRDWDGETDEFQWTTTGSLKRYLRLWKEGAFDTSLVSAQVLSLF
jgi:hypothetical protein